MHVDLEARVPADHPLRTIRRIVNDVLAGLSGEFAAMYLATGRPSIAPEKLLRALLLQAFYSIRSERQLMERLDFNLLFRWFAGVGLDDAVWDASTFAKNRESFGRECVSQASEGRRRTQEGAAPVEPGSFLGGRDADRGLSVDEVVPAQGRR